MKKFIFALIAGASAMSAVHAQGPYVGLGVATTERELSTSGLTSRESGSYTPSRKVFGGYGFTPTLGIEAGYTHLRHYDADYTTGSTTMYSANKGKRAYLAMTGTKALNEQFSVYGKAGLGYQQNDFLLTGTGYDYYANDSKSGLYGAIGAQYNLSKQVALTVEYERYGKKTGFGAIKPDAFTVGARFNF